MSVFNAAEAAEFVGMIGELLTQTAAVYARNATTGRFTDQLTTGLRCRALHVKGGQGAQTRAENAALRNFVWDPVYVLPETAQVEIEGVRWKAIPGTFGTYRVPLDVTVYRRADIVRVVS